MSVEIQLALVSAISGLAIALIPLLVQKAREQGLKISSEQEYLIGDAVREGARYAEELARRETMSGAEKLALASKHAESLLKRNRIRVDASALAPRVEASLPKIRQMESRLSIPPEFK